MPTDTKRGASLAVAPGLTLGDAQRPSLCDVLDRVLNKGAVIDGEATISVAGIDLVYLGLRLVLTSIETARRSSRVRGLRIWSGNQYQGGSAGWHLAEMPRVECESLSVCAQVMNAGAPPVECEASESLCSPSGRLNFDVNRAKNGLGQLVLTLVKLLHELLERQAIRRVDAGSLTDQQTERLGLALMQQAQEIERLRKEFGLEEEDLNLDLGPLGRLL